MMKRTQIKRNKPLKSSASLKRAEFKRANQSSFNSNGKTLPENPQKSQASKLRFRAKNRPAVPAWEKKHMAAVAEQRCVCCNMAGPSEVHHIIHGRGSMRRSPNWKTIPLCVRCHRIGSGAIHSGKESWRELHGPDYGFLPLVHQLIYGDAEITPPEMAEFWVNAG